MSRVGIMKDIPAHICWQYIHGGLRKAEKEKVRSIVFIAIPNRRQAKDFIREIAYRIGFAKSKFAKNMSEVTYKQKKQWARNLIKEEISEGKK